MVFDIKGAILIILVDQIIVKKLTTIANVEI